MSSRGPSATSSTARTARGSEPELTPSGAPHGGTIAAVIRATASYATPRPRVRGTAARRPALLILLLLTVLVLVGTDVVEQRAAAAESYRDDIWVNADGVAFERDGDSDEVAYVVRPLGQRNGGQAYSRQLTRDERDNGWAMFWEARYNYPDGYCVVWVEVEDASNWHESEGSTACRGDDQPATETPTPTPTPTQTERPAQGQRPAPAPKPARPEPQDDAATPTPTPSSTPTPTPTSTPTPSATPSPSVSSTPSPSPTPTPSDTDALQGLYEQQGPRTQAVAIRQDEVISPLGWVAVLGSGAVLTAGGVLMLWRRLT